MELSTDHPTVAEGFAARVRALEESQLDERATRSYPARRPRPEEDCSLRTPFQRDRDRIVHSKAFRRLKHKTQVFVAPEGDHYRTRLTHTLEVTQISRTVARALRLNEDLAEAIGLGHDLGHPPFGHLGEAALDACVRERYGGAFRHYEHSLRVVDRLERDGAGLNLSEPVRDGILRHSGGAPDPATPEGRIETVIRTLFERYAADPPPGVEGASEAERVVDYLAGMTDRFCIREFEALTVPRSFA